MKGTITVMPQPNVRRLLVSACAGAFLLASGCHHVQPAPAIDAPTQFAQTMRRFRAGDFAGAQTGFQRLQFDLAARDTLQAKLRFYLAESYVGQGELVTAAREFRRVSDDFPSDALAPVALLRCGDAYGMLWRRAELDPTNGETALTTYQELLARYPDAPAARIGDLRIRTLQESFARKDFENGLFYYKRAGYDSAILYFRSMIAKYPSSSYVAPAYVKLVEAYRAIGYREEMNETCAHLRQYFGGRADVRQVCGNGSPGR
jgi:outer membrane protein assembly factor BamD